MIYTSNSLQFDSLFHTPPNNTLNVKQVNVSKGYPDEGHVIDCPTFRTRRTYVQKNIPIMLFPCYAHYKFRKLKFCMLLLQIFAEILKESYVVCVRCKGILFSFFLPVLLPLNTSPSIVFFFLFYIDALILFFDKNMTFV